MTTKVRKQIYLDRDQELQLKRLAVTSGLSEAEIVRRMFNLQLGVLASLPRDLSAWEEDKRFIREWLARPRVTGGRSWKREDLYDRHER